MQLLQQRDERGHHKSERASNEPWDHFQSKKNFGSSDFSKYTEFVDLGGTSSTSVNADEDATVVRGPMDAFMKTK